jgi:hypothetical protein
MRFQTPQSIANLIYVGVDTKSRHSIGDELAGLSIGRLYAGIYPTSTGFDLSVGILNQYGCLE